jgi:hypothetical protein
MSAVASKAAWLMIETRYSKEKMPVCSVLNTVAIGSGLWETVGMARPTKEAKIRRRAKKAQRKLDKQRGEGGREDHDGIGKLIATEGRKKTSAESAGTIE